MKKEAKNTKKKKHHFDGPRFRITHNFGQKSADLITKWAGSWTFIISFLLIIAVWILINSIYLVQYKQGQPFDPFPFILLNLALSLLAALQAPVILMSQNRQTQRDRLKTEYDFRINKTAEREIREIKNLLLNRKKTKSKP